MAKIGKINRKFPERTRSNLEFNKYLATFAIATLLLIVGIIIGNYLADQKISDIKEMENTVQFDLMSLEIQNILFEKNPCTASITPIEEKLIEITSRISYMEDQLGKNDPNVIQLKKYYSMLEIRHYLLMENRKERCDSNYTLILFFYSNNPDKISEGEKQGYVLDSLRQEYSVEKIKVYSLDKNLEISIIGDLARLYNVEDIPSIVINGQTLIGFHNKEELKSYI